MTPDRPSHIAAWLLRTLGSSPNGETIIGDLDERYRNGRSRSWYWRQVIIAIFSSTLAEVRSHKFLAARAVLLGIVVLHAIAKLMFNLYGRLLIATVNDRLVNAALIHEGPFPFWVFPLFAVVVFIVGMWSGWIVARFHRRHQFAMVLLYGLSTPFYLFLFALLKGIEQSLLSGGGSL